ncbi:hypothetical protein HMPREF7215_1241 [Pyramidobacter piscolens W5455]|uniref:Uncharacterized protein n=1 Tax=Pyramidobacter piscolens W5455 TaxID=352165 RepID=A0ABM9ZTT6_9BACT|nr:hypothetical protein HMPREF7215_1241 [Pyramidobacter piscolens W5455]
MHAAPKSRKPHRSFPLLPFPAADESVGSTYFVYADGIIFNDSIFYEKRKTKMFHDSRVSINISQTMQRRKHF